MKKRILKKLTRKLYHAFKRKEKRKVIQNMEKASLNKIVIELVNEKYVYSAGWTSEGEEHEFFIAMSEALSQCCFDVVLNNAEKKDSTVLYSRGEEFVEAGPIYITMYVTQYTAVEIRTALEKNNFVISDMHLSDDEEYYCLSKEEFFEMLDENRDRIEERIKEAFVPSSPETYIKQETYARILLNDIDIGFGIINVGTRMSMWQQREKFKYLMEIFDELVEDEIIIECFESLSDDGFIEGQNAKVIGYRTQYR